MPDQLIHSCSEALCRVLGGSYLVSVDPEITAVFAALPDRCPATATRVEGHVWIVVDLAKPDAIRQARAMLNDYGDSLSSVDLGDDDLNREWQHHNSVVPLPRPGEPPLSVMPLGIG